MFSKTSATAPTPTTPTTAPNPAVVRNALDLALDDWWRSGVLPPLALVRDSLLLLEAGEDLDDAQRSLLLRSCIAGRKGMLTALRYQTDPARTALILADALLQAEDPLTPEAVNWLRNQDTRSGEWYPALHEILQEEVGGPDVERAARAQAALALLAGATWLEAAQAEELAPGFLALEPTAAPLLRSTWMKALLALVLVAAVAALVIWQQQQARLQDLVVIPAGVYPSAGGTTAGEAEELPAFAVDRTEVTIAAYRRCYEQGACPWPTSNASARRPNYLLDPTFGQYPVVNVDWEAANRYCAWAGKRLPTADEWEIAASFAPATQRRYRFPWGDQFLIQAANSAPAAVGDTQAVRTYQPIGDSPFGISDLAGNVAEWTATAAEGGYVVKGGSYQDDAAALEVATRRTLPPATAEPWLGFRCAASMAPGGETGGN
jgi:formylglycine-generating enzyme required for sulfatase activity